MAPGTWPTVAVALVAFGVVAGGNQEAELATPTEVGRAINSAGPVRNQTRVGRAPSCGGCERRESVLSKTLRLNTYSHIIDMLGGPIKSSILVALVALAICFCTKHIVSRELLVTLFYSLLYLIASPTAILVNKILMKDYGFGYPVMVSAFGQSTTAVCAFVLVRSGFETPDKGRHVGCFNLVALGGASALALVLGQYPYLYLTVAFIQMLKAFSPAYMVLFLSCMGVEYPSRRVIFCVLGLSICTAVASAGEVNFNVIGVLFMAGASCSDALRLVIAQKLLKNFKLKPIETLYYTSPVCLLWMVPAALATEVPLALQRGSFTLMRKHPLMFMMSGFSGFFVNITSFLLVKRTSSMTLKTMTMTRNGGLVIFSALLMGETITSLEAVGYSGLLVFFALYTYTKATEIVKPDLADRNSDEVSVSEPLMKMPKSKSSPLSFTPLSLSGGLTKGGGSTQSLRESESDDEPRSPS